MGPRVEEMGAKANLRDVPTPRSLSLPFHPVLGEEKVKGKYDRCNSLQNELITRQSHREMRLAEERLIKGARVCT